MLGIIIVSLLGFGIAISLILLVVVASKRQAAFRSDRLAQADVVMVSYYRMQATSRTLRAKPAQLKSTPIIQPVP